MAEAPVTPDGGSSCYPWRWKLMLPLKAEAHVAPDGGSSCYPWRQKLLLPLMAEAPVIPDGGSSCYPRRQKLLLPPTLEALSDKYHFSGWFHSDVTSTQGAPLQFPREYQFLSPCASVKKEGQLMFNLTPGSFCVLNISYLTSRFVRWCLRKAIHLMIQVDFDVRNRENTISNKPYIIVCNHQSSVDLLGKGPWASRLILTGWALFLADVHSFCVLLPDPVIAGLQGWSYMWLWHCLSIDPRLKETGREQFWPKKGSLHRTRKNLKNLHHFTPFSVNKMFSINFNTFMTLSHGSLMELVS
jgi:hypothetical protein